MTRYRLPVASFLTALTCVASACGQAIPPSPGAGSASTTADGINTTIGALRQMPDDQRAKTTKDLALQIRQLPAGADRASLAQGLATLSTEGDFGRDTLQEVTNTLALVLRGNEFPAEAAGRAFASLAQLARYEGMRVDVDSPTYREALADVDRLATIRGAADFTLTDLDGHSWTRSALTGKVVMVNFWATWCPPCRKEMPDLEALATEFGEPGLVVLALSNEPEATVRAFIQAHPVRYPILLDTGGRVSDKLSIDSIPKTFVYDRTGRMVAQSIDMRTKGQFLKMLEAAGL
ncbi:MAG: TlpA disulfide reductase family protein [Acidobacteriota bacterium]